MKENWRKNSNIYLPVLFKNWFFWDFNAPFDTNPSSLNWHLKGLFSSWTDSLGDLNAPFLKMLPQKIWKWMAYSLHELICGTSMLLFFWKRCLKKLAFEWLIFFMNWFNMGFQCSVCEKIFLYKIGIWEAYFFHELIHAPLHWLKIFHPRSIEGHQAI